MALDTTNFINPKIQIFISDNVIHKFIDDYFLNNRFSSNPDVININNHFDYLIDNINNKINIIKNNIIHSIENNLSPENVIKQSTTDFFDKLFYLYEKKIMKETYKYKNKKISSSELIIKMFFDIFNEIQIQDFIRNNYTIFNEIYKHINKYRSYAYGGYYHYSYNTSIQITNLVKNIVKYNINVIINQTYNIDDKFKSIHQLNNINKLLNDVRYVISMYYYLDDTLKRQILELVNQTFLINDIDVITYVIEKYNDIIKPSINDNSMFLILYTNILNVQSNNKHKIIKYINSIYDNIINTKVLHHMEKTELIKIMIEFINRQNKEFHIIDTMIYHKSEFIFDIIKTFKTEDYIKFLHNINSIIDNNINNFIQNKNMFSILLFIKKIFNTKIKFTDYIPIMNTIIKKINDLILSKNYYEHTPNLDNYNILITSYLSFNTKSLTDLTKYDNEYPYFSYLLNNSNTFETYYLDKKMYWCLENGKVTIEFNNITLTLLPIQLLILEQIENEIDIDDIIDYSFDKEKIINIFINNHIIQNSNNMLSLITHEQPLELNIISDYHENKNIIINKEIEYAHDKIDILKCIINHILKHNDTNYDELFNQTTILSNQLVFNKELFDNAIDELINKDYIQYDTEIEIYKKLIY
jgi:hypothetical protein